MHAVRSLAAAAAALLPAALACAPPAPEPEIRLDATHDLVALFPRAALIAGDGYPLDRVPDVDDALDRRDGVAYLRAPPETVMVWHELPTSGPATLEFAVGALALDPPPPEVAVTFRVEGRDVAAGEAEFTTLYERRLVPGELPRPAARLPVTLDLGDRDAARWTLRLSTTRDASPVPPATDAIDAAHGTAAAAATPAAAAGTDTEAAVRWPAWFAPRLRSPGRAVPVARHPTTLVETTLDLLDTFPRARVVQRAEDAPPRRARVDPAPGIYAAGGERPALRMPAPARVAWEVEVPVGARFQFSYAQLVPDGHVAGDGLDFAVHVDGERLWTRRLHALRNVEDRGWRRQQLDLTAHAGRTVSLELVTAPTGPLTLDDEGAWSRLQLLRRRPVPRLAAGERPHILLIVIDTLRADRLGVYGHDGGLTPRLDAHAAGGLVVSGARAVSPWTWPSTASILTGLWPYEHGVLGEGHTDLAGSLDTLAEVLARAGYTTGGFVSNALVSRRSNFHQGFETFVGVPRARARALNARVADWLDGREQLALFTYVHYLDPHTPYLPPRGHEPPDGPPPTPDDLDPLLVPQLQAAYPGGFDASRLDELAAQLLPDWRAYDAEVAYVDQAVGELLDEFERRGLLDDTLVLVTSDHGEEFLEHGLRYHSEQLYEESLRVPLWIRGHGAAAFPPGVLEGPADLRAIVPTLCALAGVTAPEGATAPPLLRPTGEGREVAVADDAGTAPASEPFFAQTLNGYEPGIEGRTEKLAARHRGWKLIHTPASGRDELYHLERDPGEIEDLSERHPEIVAALREALLTWRDEGLSRRPTPGGVTSPAALYWLRELGYLGDDDG